MSHREDPAPEESPDAARQHRRGRRSTSIGIRDVARAAGVSTATVSRVLNNPAAVSKDVQRAVLAAVERLDYVPDSAARALSLRRSNTLGIVIPTIKDSIFAAQVEALQMRASHYGYNLVIALSGFELADEFRQVEQLVKNGVEGLMLVGARHQPALFELLERRGVHFVSTSVYEPQSPYPSIGFDNAAATARAANYLIQLGHRHIAVISTDTSQNDRATYRLQGIRGALAAAGLSLDPKLVYSCGYTFEESRLALRELLARDPRITAVLCHNDVIAFGALLEAQSLGMAVPDDLSLVGFDDLAWAAHLRPSLTTIRVPWGQMATLAADFLVRRLRGEETAHATKIEFDLVVRESAGPPRARR